GRRTAQEQAPGARCFNRMFESSTPRATPGKPHRMTSDPARRAAPARRHPRSWLRRWWARLNSASTALRRDKVSIMAAGTAYYTMLSIFPGMSALVLSYGLVADPAAIARHVDVLAGVLPGEALKLMTDQLRTLVEAPPSKLGIGLVVSIL